MPIYGYLCKNGHNFDLKQGFDADTEQVCPECGEMAPRQFVAPTVIYKGSGFYTTDYARKSGGDSSSSTSTSTGSSKPKSAETSAETSSKPAADTN